MSGLVTSGQVAEAVSEQDSARAFHRLHNEAHIVLLKELLCQVGVHVVAVVYVDAVPLQLKQLHQLDLLGDEACSFVRAHTKID